MTSLSDGPWPREAVMTPWWCAAAGGPRRDEHLTWTSDGWLCVGPSLWRKENEATNEPPADRHRALLPGGDRALGMRHSPRRRTGYPIARAQHREERAIAGPGDSWTVPSAVHEPPDKDTARSHHSRVIAKDASTAPHRPAEPRPAADENDGARTAPGPLRDGSPGGRRLPWERSCSLCWCCS